jgi:hypothetical protein
MFQLILTQEVQEVLDGLKGNVKRLRKVRKTLAQLERDPRYPGLNSHQYETLCGPLGEPIWESYVENQTPAAWRVWWYYGPEPGYLTVVTVGGHPS